MKVKFFDLLVKFILGFFLVGLIFPAISIPVRAQTFSPSFSVSVVDTTAGVNSDLTGDITQLAGEDLLRNVTFNVPAGWDIAGGLSLSQDEVVGTGSFSMIAPSGSTMSGSMTFKNDLTINPGDKAHWILEFTPGPQLDVAVSGDVSTGHTIIIVRTSDLTGYTTPSEFNFTFLGTTASSLPVFTNPTAAGDYTWSIDVTSETNLSASSSQTLTMPGTVTSTGTDVEVSMGGSISITYDSVTTGGETTIVKSATPPPEGTGQFQVSGDLYYDFDTTAIISCPCTVTLPYDPVTTPDPKIYHLENGIWVDATISVDIVNSTVTGIVSSFSFFAAGQPEHTAEWLSPVKAFENQGELFGLNRNQALPLNLIVRGSNGNVVQPVGLVVELWKVVDPRTSLPVTSAYPKLVEDGDHLKTKINLKDLSVEPGEYYLRVIIEDGNTTLAPDVHFTVS